ncbi:MAG: pyruvate kinase [Lachnospiraceae bacterium]|nr:pyruvate kinase [Lachnospiraceae bacterium]
MHYYGTLGPACRDTNLLTQMFQAGMTGMRLNLSHMTLEEAANDLALFREAAANAGVVPELLIDLQGPELRIGRMPSLLLKDSDIVLLKDSQLFAEEAATPVPAIPVPRITLPYLTAGQEVLLDDGKILLTVQENDQASAKAVVKRGGTLVSRKSMAIPGASIHPPALTDQDFANLAVAKKYGVTGVMQPFVRSREDLEAVRAALLFAGAGDVRIFAKIENLEGMEQLPELLPAADEIVIARGDLGNSMPLWKLPAAQKILSSICKKADKPFMVVTQMLYSMENAAVPTRAEVSDIFNAVLDGASSVMVTGETAVGHFPVEVMKYLVNTGNAACEWLDMQKK